jgi:hypothetical protein
MRKTGLISIFLLLTSNSILAQVVIQQDKSTLSIENKLTALRFDLDDGTYKAINLVTGQEYLTDASFMIESLSSADNFLKYSWKEEPVTDKIGTGKKLVITGSKTGLPDVIFEVSLYSDKTFLVLNCGINNITAYPVKIKSFHPLIGKKISPENKDELFYLLDGNGGGENTNVSIGNELQCRNNLLCVQGIKDHVNSFVIGGLTYHEFEKFASVKNNITKVKENVKTISIDIDLYCQDPVGKLIESGSLYLPDDKFYIDFCTSNPLESLEKYGQTIRIAQNIKLNVYDFVSFCLWYGGMDQYGGGPKNNDSPGAVWEMEQAKKRGFLKYAGVAIRLVPDNDKQQGWWDDEHFQKIANTANYIGPCYKPPYETTKKWGDAIKRLGGIPFMYSRSGWRTEEFCIQYPEYMLYNNSSRGYDFTDPGFIKHMENVYANWREGNIKGMMFDYPGTAWAADGGFEDEYATAASAFRNMFKLASDGLGPDSYIQENKLSRGSDITLGVVESQRTAGDADKIDPISVSRDGYRWYKNRVVINYDKDAKNPNHANPLNRDGWRTMYTISYVTGGRFLLGLSFSKLTEDQYQDLTRIFPFHNQPLSARPVDAFMGKIYPQVYDFIVNKDWHQVTFYNATLDKEIYEGNENYKYPVGNYIPAEICIAGSGEPGFGALGLEPESNYYLYDFWNDVFLGRISGSDTIKQSMRAGETRMLSVHKVENNPQFISTNRHIMQGLVDMVEINWNDNRKELSGISNVVAGETYKIIIVTNGRKISRFTAKNASADWKLTDGKNGLITLSINSPEGGHINWTASFK